jgi:hypothetical protein
MHKRPGVGKEVSTLPAGIVNEIFQAYGETAEELTHGLLRVVVDHDGSARGFVEPPGHDKPACEVVGMARNPNFIACRKDSLLAAEHERQQLHSRVRARPVLIKHAAKELPGKIWSCDARCRLCHHAPPPET